MTSKQEERLRNKISKIKRELVADKKEWDTGFIIGKCENILILTYMFLDAYIALAIIFAAKTIIREDDIKKNSLYYLAGTMINVTYSIIIGAIIKGLILI